MLAEGSEHATLLSSRHAGRCSLPGPPSESPTACLMRVLVVDDEDQVLHLVTSMLELEGHEVVTASHGEEALLRVEESRPDAILLDIVLPRMDGATVAQKLREDPGTADIPIVFLTGLVEDDKDQKRGLVIGGQYFLAKPFDSERLYSVLALATEKS